MSFPPVRDSLKPEDSPPVRPMLQGKLPLPDLGALQRSQQAAAFAAQNALVEQRETLEAEEAPDLSGRVQAPNPRKRHRPAPTMPTEAAVVVEEAEAEVEEASDGGGGDGPSTPKRGRTAPRFPELSYISPDRGPLLARVGVSPYGKGARVSAFAHQDPSAATPSGLSAATVASPMRYHREDTLAARALSRKERKALKTRRKGGVAVHTVAKVTPERPRAMPRRKGGPLRSIRDMAAIGIVAS